MDFDPATLFAGLVVSAVGFVLFRYGKSQERIPQMVVGVMMMVAPIFSGGPLLTLAIGGGLGATLWLGVRMGM
jgi:hypothetical protein